MTREWELTYEPVKKGKVLVGVHSDDEKDVDRGAQILEKLNRSRSTGTMARAAPCRDSG